MGEGERGLERTFRGRKRVYRKKKEIEERNNMRKTEYRDKSFKLESTTIQTLK